MVIKKRNLCGILILILSISLVPAASIVQFEGNNVDYAVINNQYLIYTDSNISHSEVNLLTQSNGINTYGWNTSTQAGVRDFGSFNFSVISQTQELLGQIDNYVMFISENESYFEIQGFDLFDTSFEYLNISYENYAAHINLANFLNGINANITFQEGELYPQVNSFNLNSSTATMVTEAILSQQGHSITADDLNLDPQYYVNYLIDYYNLSTEYPRTMSVIKTPTISRLEINEGYGLEGEIADRIRNYIQEGIVYINPMEVNDKVFEMTGQNISDYLGMDALNNLNLTIDFGELSEEAGTYIMSFDYTDIYGNIGQKEFTTIINIEVEEEVEEVEDTPSQSSGSRTRSVEANDPIVKNITQKEDKKVAIQDPIIDISPKEEEKKNNKKGLIIIALFILAVFLIVIIIIVTRRKK